MSVLKHAPYSVIVTTLNIDENTDIVEVCIPCSSPSIAVSTFKAVAKLNGVEVTDADVGIRYTCDMDANTSIYLRKNSTLEDYTKLTKLYNYKG